MKKAVKKKVGRPPGRKAARRPVLATRVPEEFYETIKQAAQVSGRTLSEELIWRARQSFEWETARGTVTKMINDSARMLEGELRAGLRMKGWTPVLDLNGTFWLEPGMPIPPMKGQIPDGLKEAMVDAVKQAIAETKKEGSS